MDKKRLERKKYELGMSKAAKDPFFLKRTMECQRQFDAIESDIPESWT